MKNDELREQQLGILMDLNNGKLCVNEANTKIRELYTEPNEQDVCPECGGTKKKLYRHIDKKTGEPAFIDCPSCTGKAPVDKIREKLYVASRQYRHNNSDGFVHGYDVDEVIKIVSSQQAEIERLIKIIEDMPADYIPEGFWKRKGE